MKKLIKIEWVYKKKLPSQQFLFQPLLLSAFASSNALRSVSGLV